MMNGRSAVVAVVEDDLAMLKALERLLRASGYGIEAYTSAEMYLTRTSKTRVQCLLLDVNLGGMSGIELQGRLHAAPGAPPIIFITAQTDSTTRARAFAMGCLAYLNKPFESRLLLQALKDLESTSCR